ncbi:Disulfide bond formation protein B (Disulfide oxidoreductase) (plasmid) [Legionella adelaidensis]|uniref:Disulfide bond formation protein B n=1 Tax=Legionella adelaidensis TaxID=45056 RepID=A0A0W0R5X2_9GAMM|nr:disulfide bond formation protein B [Legionella adelaidensis]KTC66483.1 disulfide bond formation protein DsbB [Legionella adelaidensis]VEH86229.1 Disulfide bond formation protein B (Disulfide oxidoreductase) [Legionella adelaidensis]
MNKRIFRVFESLLFLATTFVLFSSFYFQYFQELQPCPLCLMQRLCIFFIFFLCLSGMFLSTLKRARIITFWQVFFSLAGIFFVSRQLWLQSLSAENVPACLPGLDVLIRYFPWQEVAHALFWGDGECAESTWRLWGLSMAGWAAIYFIFSTFLSGFLFWRLKKTPITYTP